MDGVVRLRSLGDDDNSPSSDRGGGGGGGAGDGSSGVQRRAAASRESSGGDCCASRGGSGGDSGGGGVGAATAVHSGCSVEAGRRFPTGACEPCLDSCRSATTCELDRPNRGDFVCREVYGMASAARSRSERVCFTEVGGVIFQRQSYTCRINLSLHS